MPEYKHKGGRREVTVAGSTRDRELAARAADKRTKTERADTEPVTAED